MSINCPSCSSQKLLKTDSFQWEQDGGKYLPNQYNLFECSNCGLWFKNYLPTEEELIKFYDTHTVETSNWNYSKRLPHEILIDKLLVSLPTNSKILDVGCWTGRLLSPYKDQLNIFGIEPNKESAKIAESNGLEILGTHVNQFNLQKLEFDCITLVDVFEHLREPLKIVEMLLQHLSDKGKLIIVTGRTDCLPVKLAGPTYWYFSKCSDHLVFLNEKFIKWLGKKNSGYNVAYKKIRHSDFKLKRFVFEFVWLFTWRFLNPNSPFKKLALYKLPILKKIKNVKEIMLCFNFKDHYLIEIKRK